MSRNGRDKVVDCAT